MTERSQVIEMTLAAPESVLRVVKQIVQERIETSVVLAQDIGDWQHALKTVVDLVHAENTDLHDDLVRLAVLAIHALEHLSTEADQVAEERTG